MIQPHQEPLPQVGFSSCRAVGLEGRSLAVNVVRSDGSGAASVQLTHVPGTATAGADYTAPATQTLSWAAGDMAPKQIVIPIASDGAPEPVETFRLQLGNPQPADMDIFPHALLEVRILDGDAQGFGDGFEEDCPE